MWFMSHLLESENETAVKRVNKKKEDISLIPQILKMYTYSAEMCIQWIHIPDGY